MNSVFKWSFHCCRHPLMLRSLLFSYHNFFLHFSFNVKYSVIWGWNVAKIFSVQPSKWKFLLGCHLATNSFGLGRIFYKSSRSSKILGAMATKMVATWRVGLERFMYSVQRNISSLLVREQDSHLIIILIFVLMMFIFTQSVECQLLT